MTIPIGKRIRKVRRELDKTQEEIAELVGFSRQALSKIENGQTESPDPSNLVSLARVLNNNFDEPWLDKYLVDSNAVLDKQEIIENTSVEEFLSLKFGGENTRRTKQQAADLRRLLEAELEKIKKEEEIYGE